jgi:hypothetical protein
LLNLDQLDMQPGQLTRVVLGLQLAIGRLGIFDNLRLLAFLVALTMTSDDLPQRACCPTN